MMMQGSRQAVRQLLRQSRAAFTLIEIVIAMSVMSVVSLSILMIFSTETHQWGQNISRATATQAAALAINRIAKETGMAMAYAASGGPGGGSYFTLPANTDAQGNYVPAWASGLLQFQSGTNVAYYLSDGTGATNAVGTILWRQCQPGGSGSWTADQAWSLRPGSVTHGNIENLTALTFSTSGLPMNTVRVAITVTVVEGKQTNTITLERDVYLSNHN